MILDRKFEILNPVFGYLKTYITQMFGSPYYQKIKKDFGSCKQALVENSQVEIDINKLTSINVNR
jgi:hypothetical protein